MTSTSRLSVLAAFCFLLSSASEAATVTVDCDAGGSIGKAIGGLKPGDTLLVSGTCKENVSIAPDVVGITLDGQGKATIQHPGLAPALGPRRMRCT